MYGARNQLYGYGRSPLMGITVDASDVQVVRSFGYFGDATCDAALAQARANKPNWTPDDSFFNPTCFDPTLSAAMAKACQCAGKNGLPDLAKKAAAYVMQIVHPSSGGGTPPVDPGSSPTDVPAVTKQASNLLPIVMLVGAGLALFKK